MLRAGERSTSLIVSSVVMVLYRPGVRAEDALIELIDLIEIRIIVSWINKGQLQQLTIRSITV